jgi:hypothetical protein
MAQDDLEVQSDEDVTGGVPVRVDRKIGIWKRFKRWRLNRLLRDPDLAAQVPFSSGSRKPIWTSTDKLKAPFWIFLAGAAIVLAVGAVKPALKEYPHGSLGAFWSEVVPLFCSEVGVALMVAYIIAWGIDSQAKRREERAREEERIGEIRRRKAEQEEAFEREQRLVQDVFRGVLGIRHSSAYVRKVIETTLEQRVIRRTVNLIYTLRRLNQAEANQIPDAGRFMVLDEAMSYEFQNLSSEEFELEVRLAVPVRHGRHLREASRLVSGSIGDQVLTEEELKPVDESGDAKKYVWKRKMAAVGKLPVALKVRLMKEESDNEVWCSFYPCSEGMTLQVVAPEGFHMGIRNNTASHHKMETDPSDNGVGVWKIEGPILPYDSVIFYWRTPEDDGDNPAEGEVAAADTQVGSPAAGGESVDFRRRAAPKARPADSATGTTESA